MHLSNEELALSIQKGDTGKLEELWEAVRGLAAWRAKQILTALEGKRGVTMDDFMQTGFLALVDAVQTFDPEAGALFSTWYSIHLRKCYVELAGFRTKTQRLDPIHEATSLDAPISDEDGDSWGEIIADPHGQDAMVDAEERLWRDQLRATVATVTGDLPEDQREILYRRFWLGQTYAEAGDGDAGIARNAESKALRRLRRPDKSKHLRPFHDFSFYAGTGLGSFRSSGLSVQERYLMKQEARPNGRF